MNRIDGCWKTSRNGDHLVAGSQAAVAQFWRRERSERNQIRGRTGVDERAPTHADKARQLLFKGLGKSSGREPAIERRINDRSQVFAMDDFSGDRNNRFSGHKTARGKSLAMKLGSELEDLFPELFGAFAHQVLFSQATVVSLVGY